MLTKLLVRLMTLVVLKPVLGPIATTNLMTSNYVSLNNIISKPISVLLSTVLVEVLDGGGAYQPIRIVLESSIFSFNSNSSLKHLNDFYTTSVASIRGIGTVESRVLRDTPSIVILFTFDN